MEKISVGVIGAGFIGPAHVEALRRLPNVEVTALAGSDEPSAKAKAQTLGVPRAFGDYRKLIACEDISAVHVCTPNHLHFEISKLALNAGKHVVCEKPLAVDSAQARELAELAERKGLANAVHYNLRYYPLVRQLKLMVEKGELGGIFAVHGSYLQDWLLYPTDYNWRLEPELSGSSRAVADIGTHWMDMVEHVSGLRIAEVFADFATFYKTRKKPLKPVETFTGKMLSPKDYADVPISTEDFATVLLRFDSGARGSFTVSQVSAGRKNRLYFQIDGSKAAAAWDQESPNGMWIGRRDRPNEILLKDPSLMYPEARSIVGFPGGHNEGFPDTSKQMFREFYGFIQGGGKERPLFATFRDGLRELLALEAILKSNDLGSWVKV